MRRTGPVRAFLFPIPYSLVPESLFFRPLRNQHRNPIDHGIRASTFGAHQPRVFHTQPAKASRASQTLQNTSIKFQRICIHKNHEGRLYLFPIPYSLFPVHCSLFTVLPRRPRQHRAPRRAWRALPAHAQSVRSYRQWRTHAPRGCRYKLPRHSTSRGR